MLFFSMFAAIDAAERRCAAEIFEKYHKLVYGIAYGILKRPLDAEDALNEVMIHVMKNMERFKITRIWMISLFDSWIII